MKYAICAFATLVAVNGVCAENSLKVGTFQGTTDAGKSCSVVISVDASDHLIPYRGKTSFASTEFDLIDKGSIQGSDELSFRGVTVGAKGAERLTVRADKRGNPLSATYAPASSFEEILCTLN